MTIKEDTFFQCAVMILHDQCPPDSNHYLCMQAEDGDAAECLMCWSNYLRELVAGDIKLPKNDYIKEAVSHGIPYRY